MKNLFALIAVAFCSTSYAQITVTGEGKALATPDVIVVNASVISGSRTASEAVQKMTKSVDAVVTSLKNKFNVNDGDICVSQLSLSPKYQITKTEDMDFVGYDASNTVSVKVRNKDKVSELIDSIVANGANKINSVTWEVTDKDNVLDEARQKALADAKRKAELYVKDSGIKISNVISIVETGNTQQYFDRSFKESDNKQRDVNVRQYNVSVTVSFQIEEQRKMKYLDGEM